MGTHVRSLAIVLGVALALATSYQDGRDTANAQQTAGEVVVGRVTVATPEEMTRLLGEGLDLLEHREASDLFILTTPEQLDELRGRGFRVSIDEEQTAVVRGQAGGLSFNGGYSTVPEMRSRLETRAAQYPTLAETFVYGDSWQRLNGQGGHELFGIRLTNTQISGPKPTFFLMAAIHARELSVSELALRFIDHLLQGYGVDADVTWLLDEHLVVVVPVVNPDGRRLAEQGYFQRKNMNPTNGFGCSNPPTVTNQSGIDLNRNFNFKWGTVNRPTESPCGQTYPGPTAASEPETAAIQSLVRSFFADQRGGGDTDPAPLTTTGVLLTLHSYGDLVLWPWGYTGATAPNAPDLTLIGRKFAGYNGYTPQQSIQLYPTSGTTDDWSYGELGIPSFTFEVGLSSCTCGGFMPPYNCLDGQSGGSFWPRNLPAFLYAARIARTPYRLVRGPTVETLTVIEPDGATEVHARIDEQRNGGQRVAAAELYLETPPWRGGTPIPMTPLDGSYDTTVETAAVSLGALTRRQLAFVRGQDENQNWGPVRAVFVGNDNAALPDLVVSALKAPANASAGALVTMTDITKNQGPGGAAATTTAYYWSSNNKYEPTDPPLGSRAVSSLPPSASQQGSAGVTIPTGAAAGRYYLLARADDGGSEAEDGEANNVRAKAIAIGPDLVVSSIAGPASAAAGTTVTFDVTTRNQPGAAPAAGSTTSLYLSLNNKWDSGDELLRSRTVSPLNGGASQKLSFTATIPAGTAPAAYYIVARADALNNVAEGNEANNVKPKAFAVTAP